MIGVFIRILKINKENIIIMPQIIIFKKNQINQKHQKEPKYLVNGIIFNFILNPVLMIFSLKQYDIDEIKNLKIIKFIINYIFIINLFKYKILK